MCPLSCLTHSQTMPVFPPWPRICWRLRRMVTVEPSQVRPKRSSPTWTMRSGPVTRDSEWLDGVGIGRIERRADGGEHTGAALVILLEVLQDAMALVEGGIDRH